ncbi:spore germination protein [Heliorestis acidaminivorans]|uniref:Spore germination protein n=1 Tax=Heliorestis acidaminivorans TaxID=553427 RepID=A0A6I0EP91_9FIRM|nr:spore germination protein [Heliorestis acidaminivorans]KAB2951707.1 spore germination protein [Heliorestis acidaminivorans]
MKDTKDREKNKDKTKKSKEANAKVEETVFLESEITRDLKANIELFDAELGVGIGFDIDKRVMEIAGRQIAMYYVNGFTRDLDVLQIMRALDEFEQDCEKKGNFDIDDLIDHRLYYLQISKEKNVRQIYYHLLSGRAILLIDGEIEAVAIEAREFPARSPEEPDIERVVRGSRDGFNEVIVSNTALIRRRIRDPRLRFKLMQVGRRSQTDVVVAYIEDIANPNMVKEVVDRIERVDVDGLPMAEKSLEEFITRGDWNPFPQVRYTERPDVSAMHLLEGHVLIMVDTSPSVMITPSTYFHHLEHAEEYRQNAPVGFYLRIIRYLAVVTSVFLLPLWLMFALDPTLLPPFLEFIGPEEAGAIPLVLQVIAAEAGLDMIRMAAIHTPSPLATALGLIAAFMIGDVAIDVGLFHPEIILYLALAAVGTFATPSYELGQTNRLVRIFLVIMVALFSWIGFIIGVLALAVLVMRSKSFGKPYFWPLAPINWRMIPVGLLRSPMPSKRWRPDILDPIDPDRLPEAYAGAVGGASGAEQTIAEGRDPEKNKGKDQSEVTSDRQQEKSTVKERAKKIETKNKESKKIEKKKIKPLLVRTIINKGQNGLESPRWRVHRRGLWSYHKNPRGGGEH